MLSRSENHSSWFLQGHLQGLEYHKRIGVLSRRADVNVQGGYNCESVDGARFEDIGKHTNSSASPL